MIVSGTSGSDSIGVDEDDQRVGKAFEVLAIDEFEHDFENVRLVTLRNPFHYSEVPANDWSADSPNWTEELKARLGFQAD